MNRISLTALLLASAFGMSASAAEPDFKAAYADFSALRIGFPQSEICQSVKCDSGAEPGVFTAAVTSGEVTLRFDKRGKLFQKTLSAKTREFSPDYYAGLADGLAMRYGLLGRQGAYASDWLLANDDVFAEMSVRRDDVTVTVSNLRYPYEAWLADARRDRALRVKLPVFPSGFFVGEISYDRVKKAVRCKGDPESEEGAVCRVPRLGKDGVVVRTFAGTDVLKTVTVPLGKGKLTVEQVRSANPQLKETADGVLSVKGDEALGGVRRETLADGRSVVTFFAAKPVIDYYEHQEGFHLLKNEVEKLSQSVAEPAAKPQN